MLAQSDLSKSLSCTTAAFGAANTGKRKGKLHIFQNAQMFDQIVILENESCSVVTISVPITVKKIRCRDTINDQVSRIEMVKTADDIQQRGLSRAGWS